MFELIAEALANRVPPGAEIDIETDIGDCPAVIYADGDLLRGALSNVVDNAVAAMPSGGSLFLTARSAVSKSASSVVFEVRDTGIGMTSETLEKSREPFFSAAPLGTGLGLAIAERVLALQRNSCASNPHRLLGRRSALSSPSARTTTARRIMATAASRVASPGATRRTSIACWSR